MKVMYKGHFFESDDGRALSGKSLATATGPGMVDIYRARNALGDTFEHGDYITLSPKFAIEHAESNAVYEEEPQIVIRASVNKRDVIEATNPGEYHYVGKSPLKGHVAYKTLGDEYEGLIPNIKYTRLSL